MIAQDDPETLRWLANASEYGGGFVMMFAHAALMADGDNYVLLRPALLALVEKYPKYKTPAR